MSVFQARKLIRGLILFSSPRARLCNLVFAKPKETNLTLIHAAKPDFGDDQDPSTSRASSSDRSRRSDRT